MGMSSTPAAPPAPDPVATANAQANSNQSTATTQQLLNMTNQVGPDGSLTYNQTGNNSFTDANGKSISVPQFTATTSLNPVSQGIYNTNKQTEGNIANIGRDQSARIGDLLGTPLKLGNEATEARLMDLGTRRLNPQFAMDAEGLRTRLANSGIKEGSAAYDAAQHNLDYSHNDAINSLLLSGRAQANNEIMSERNQPINEITALMSGSQVSNPTFGNTPQAQVGGVDVAGITQSAYNNQVQQQQMKMQNNQALMGGLFSLGGAAIGAGGRIFSPVGAGR